uniref:ABC transporter permease n=1 Tax=Nocardia cyriacigeorgica TaxID=135487 RepID=UPI002453B436
MAVRYRNPAFAKTARRAGDIARAPLNGVDRAGEQMSFYCRAIAWIPRTAVHYRKEVMRLLAEVTFGSGALAVIGGTIGVIVFMSGSVGVVVGLQGFKALDSLGSSVLTGFLTAYINTREIAPRGGARGVWGTGGWGLTPEIGGVGIYEGLGARERDAVA